MAPPLERLRAALKPAIFGQERAVTGGFSYSGPTGAHEVDIAQGNGAYPHRDGPAG